MGTMLDYFSYLQKSKKKLSRSDIDKLNDLTSKLEEMFQVGVD
jgi:hypothetical protein